MRTDDLAKVLEWRNSEPVRRNMYTSHLITPEEHKIWWDKVSADSQCEYFIAFAGAADVGVVSFSQIDSASRTAFWAFYASPDPVRGTGSRMELAALDMAFNGLKLRKLCCEVLSFNESVIRLHKKFGFVEEGVFRDQHVNADGAWDIHRLAIFDREWARRRSSVLTRLGVTGK
jgi:UDP-4-amino-4,6-dideoxy-N-acetyl-beta-L-altrosamine N-acetyltransferase